MTEHLGQSKTSRLEAVLDDGTRLRHYKAFAVECPDCGALAGFACVRGYEPQTPMRGVHRARDLAYNRIQANEPEPLGVETLMGQSNPSLVAAVDQLRAGVRDMQALIDWLRKAYRESGAPYGDDDTGLRRWVEERVESLKSAPDIPYYPRIDDD